MEDFGHEIGTVGGIVTNFLTAQPWSILVGNLGSSVFQLFIPLMKDLDGGLQHTPT